MTHRPGLCQLIVFPFCQGFSKGQTIWGVTLQSISFDNMLMVEIYVTIISLLDVFVILVESVHISLTT